MNNKFPFAAHKFLILTKRVLPISNTFVASQARYLSDFEPIYTGFSTDNSGIDLIGSSKICVLEAHSNYRKLSKLLLEGFGHVSIAWREALSSYQPRFIHAHFGKGGYYGAALSDALGIPLIVSFHGSDVTQKDKYSYNQRHRRTVFEEAEKVIASSKFIQQKLIARGCPEEKISLHYIGIDNQFFSPFGEKSMRPTILFVGRLIRQKGCDYLLRAMARINKEIPDARLCIAGDGVERRRLEGQAKRLRNVKFLGTQNQNQVRQLVNEAWVMCAPSIILERGNEEGLGMVFLEAQAMGTPVVSFATGGVVEAVEHNTSGLLVREKSVGELTEALLTILGDEQTRKEFGKRGMERIDRSFSLQKQTLSLEKVYADYV